MNWRDELRRLVGRVRNEAPASEPLPDAPGGLSCREAAERVYEWLDGELEPDMADRVGTHLQTCARCYPFLRFETSFREAVTRAAAHARSETPTPAGLEARILESLAEAGFGTPSPPGPDGEEGAGDGREGEG